MVNKIAIRLQIPQPEKIIYIQDIARIEDIEAAKRSRMIEGKHVIPVSSFEVKKNYPQIFHDRITLMLKRKSKNRAEQVNPIEKSLVRPLYTKIEAVQISDEALKEFASKSIYEFNSEIIVNHIGIIHAEETKSYVLEVAIDIPFDAQVSNRIESLKKFVIERIEKYAAVSIANINVVIDKIIVKA